MTDMPGMDPVATYRKGLTLAVFGGLLLTFDAPLLRLVGGDQWAVIYWRGILVFSATAIVWYWAHHTRRISHGFINGWQGVAVTACYTVGSVSFLLALHHTSIANLVFMLAAVPLIAALLSLVILRERIPLSTWIAVSAVVLGVVIIVRDGIVRGHGPGDILALIAATSVALAVVLTRKSNKNFSTAPGIAGLFSAIVALSFADTVSLAGEQWAWIALNGLFVAPLAFAALALAPRYMPAPEVGMFHLLETVLAPIWIWLMIGEAPTMAGLTGGAIVIVSLTAHSLYLLRKSKQTSTPPALEAAERC
ncbi:MAG: DMT family transporter [Hyphomicrobiales bacterium]